MSQLGFRFYQLWQTNKTGSYSTRASRKKLLNLIADQLIAGGYKLTDPSGLKPKHIEYLVQRWMAEKLSVHISG